MDVRKLIDLTAQDLGAAGWDDSTGYGLIDAGKALQVLQPPNTVVFGTAGVNPAGCYTTTSNMNWTWWADFNVTEAERCEVRRNVSFPRAYTSAPIVWGRPTNSGGITPSNPNSQIYYTDVVPGSVTTTGATLRTWVYHRWDLQGHDLGWYPASPTSVTFAYAAVGTPVPIAPFTVSPSVTSLVTTKSTVPLNGSASDPADNWLWEQSTDGGTTWSNWANTQNSQFVAYAGNYSLNWRLSAQRLSDQANASATAITQVCIPYNINTCHGGAAPPIAAVSGTGIRSSAYPRLGVPSVYQGDGSNHFGSGLWVGLIGSGGDTTVVRFYSFKGEHAVGGGWPNMLGRESVNWVAHVDRGATVRVSARRERVEDGITIYHVTGDVGSLRPARGLIVALAADPDLGDPSSDTLGFDADNGLVWVRGSDSTYLGYQMLGGAGAHVAQIGTSQMVEPSTAGGQYQLLTDLSLVPGPRQDVRFLLGASITGADATGRFAATFSMVQATSYAGLRTLAGIALSKYGTDTSFAVSGTTPSAFSLRQAMARSSGPIPVEADQTASPALGRDALRRNGITSLDYDVPAGADIQIRIYNSAGQFVRTLVNQHAVAGSYHVDWDLLDARGARVSPGVYTAVMAAGGYHASRKLVVTR